MVTDLIEVIIAVTVAIVKLMINFEVSFVLMSVRGRSLNLHCHFRSDNLLVMSAYSHLLPLLGPVNLQDTGTDPSHSLLT